MEHEARKLQNSKGYKDRQWDKMSAYEKAQRPKEGQSRKEYAKKMKVKHGESMGFDKHPKVWQGGRTGKQSENVMNMKGYDKSERRKPIDSKNIPF